MELPLAYYGDPVLRKKVSPIAEITPEIRQLAQDMIETMRANNGIGLAAPQVHHSIALFVTEVPVRADGKTDDEINEEDEEEDDEGDDEEFDENSESDRNNGKWIAGPVKVYINPKILAYSDEQCTNDEGCLSIPKVFGPVTRPIAIKIKATDLEGKEFESELTWLEARCFMHENDHINGVLFVDRVQGKARTALEPKLKALKKKK